VAVAGPVAVAVAGSTGPVAVAVAVAVAGPVAVAPWPWPLVKLTQSLDRIVCGLKRVSVRATKLGAGVHHDGDGL